jgi:hypothetical protein
MISNVFDDIRTHWFYVVIAFFLSLSVIFALRALYPFSNDDIAHYLIARTVWKDPWELINFWGRPAFTIIHALPANIGYLASRLTSVLLSGLAAWSAVLISRHLGLKNAGLAFALVFVQPAFFELSYSTLTETVGAVILGFALYYFIRQRYVVSSLLFSILPLARPEGFFIGVLIGLWYLCYLVRDVREQGAIKPAFPWIIRVLLLATGALLWNTLGYLNSGDPFWLLHANTYVGHGTGYYGYGHWYDFVVRMPEYIGPVLIPLFMLGLWRALWKSPTGNDSFYLVAVVWLFFFLLQTVLWTFGLFKSAGYVRFFVTVAPLMGILSLYGMDLFLSRWPRFQNQVITVLVLVSLGFSLTIADWERSKTGYANFQRMDDYYRQYVADHGRPEKVFCNYVYFDFLHDNLRNTEWRPLFRRNELDQAPPGTLVLWVYPYGRKGTSIEPDYFYSREVLAEVDEFRNSSRNYLHLVHTARAPWRELMDFSDVNGPDDKWPFFQKVFIKE